jgi:M6 family metalloprotease-like protein
MFRRSPVEGPRAFVSSYGLTIVSLAALFGLAAGLRPAAAMPPPAPGNTRGLPASVREKLRQDPDLFYPRNGFRNVIERQKADKARFQAEFQKGGLSPKAAEAAASSRITTTRFCPVLCGIYADKGSPDWPVADLVDQLFSLDYGATNALGHPGSMREHYRDMSYGTFDLQGGVFGWFPVPQNKAFYASDDNGLGTDRATGEAGSFIRHTLEASDATTDFRLYDNDGPDNVPNSGDDDGYVDLVMFVHPNEGGECGGDDIWSHSFVYSGWTQHNGQPFTTNDIGANGQPLKVDDYVIMPAVSCFGGRIEIGVFSHEFGHALGLPDLYDRTAYDPAGAVSTGGVGLFCLMAAGSYGGDYSHPETPTQMCAWVKEELGWLSPREIICDETLPLYYQGDAPEAVKLWQGGDYSRGEWFLVENRQRKKWDRYLLGTGFLITHVDNNVFTQNDESCPTGNPCLSGHYQVMVVEADNQWEMQIAAAPLAGPWFGEAEDFFNAANNANWDDLTLPSSRTHQGSLSGVSVHDISASGDKMIATFSTDQTCTAVPELTFTSSRLTGGCDLDGFLDPGETASLAVTIRNLPTAAPAGEVTGTLVSLSPDVTVVEGTTSFPDLGQGKFGEGIVPFRIQAGTAAACSSTASLRLDLTATGGYSVSQNLTVKLATDSLFVPTATFLDDIEGGTENGWHHYASINEDDWSHNTNANHTVGAVPGHSWFASSPATGKDASLEPPAFIPSASSVVSFWHRYDTEDNWDGVVLELSTDGGNSWTDVGDDTNLGYDDAVTVNPQSTISGQRCWNGLSNTFPLFEQITLNMAPWAGQSCILRFRIATDLAATGVTPTPGYSVDDYQVTNASILREQCEATPVCTGIETDPPVFAGLESAVNPNVSNCDAADLKWPAASDASGPVTYFIYVSGSSPVSATTPVASTTALKYRVTGLAPNGNYHFLVRARDSQGNVDANTVERSLPLACDSPDIVVRSFKITEAPACDGDNRPDGGEHLHLVVTLENASFSNAGSVVATLRDVSGRILVNESSATYGDLAARHFEDGSQVFDIGIDSSTPCLTPAQLAIDITADGGYAVTRTIDLLLESDEAFQPLQFFDDVEGVEPNGFTHSAETGTDDWGYVTSASYSPSHSWFASDAGAVKNASLVSPPLYVSPGSVLSFRHQYILEEGFDGAVLEISTDEGATWQDIGASYNSAAEPLGVAFGSPFAPGTAFWSGHSGGFVLETVNLGAATSPLGEPLYAGNVVLIRWRIGCDDTNSEPPFVGWWVDDISLTDSGTFTTVCDATEPCLIVGVPDSPRVPVFSLLEQNRPNPMSPSTVFGYRLGQGDAGPVSLRIYNIAGQVVRTLVNEPQAEGSYEVVWDGGADGGQKVPGGIYFYELRTRSQRFVNKLTKVR